VAVVIEAAHEACVSFPSHASRIQPRRHLVEEGAGSPAVARCWARGWWCRPARRG
jgi:hypothetical protein